MIDTMKIHASEETTVRRNDRVARSAITFAPTSASDGATVTSAPDIISDHRDEPPLRPKDSEAVITMP